MPLNNYIGDSLNAITDVVLISIFEFRKLGLLSRYKE